MSGFVEECRKEWSRLRVPEAVANEMAVDLAADLSEAESEGASPEEVLGNGVFDARSFAASWASALGVVPSLSSHARGRLRGRWVFAAGAAVSLIVGLVGLVVVVGRRGASLAEIVRGPIASPFVGRHVIKISPTAHSPFVFASGSGLRALGLVLLVVGLVGLGLTLWLWRLWAIRPRRTNLELSSFL